MDLFCKDEVSFNIQRKNINLFFPWFWYHYFKRPSNYDVAKCYVDRREGLSSSSCSFHNHPFVLGSRVSSTNLKWVCWYENNNLLKMPLIASRIWKTNVLSSYLCLSNKLREVCEVLSSLILSSEQSMRKIRMWICGQSWGFIILIYFWSAFCH